MAKPLAWAVRMIHLGREYAEGLLPSYTNQKELVVDVPDDLILHARPVSLIVKIVEHHGTPVTCEVEGNECNAGSILEMMITVGSNTEARRYLFTGDERPLADIQRLFEAGLGERGLLGGVLGRARHRHDGWARTRVGRDAAFAGRTAAGGAGDGDARGEGGRDDGGHFSRCDDARASDAGVRRRCRERCCDGGRLGSPDG